MHYFATGAAGFIGSNFVDRLLQAGYFVIGCDFCFTGMEHFLGQVCAFLKLPLRARQHVGFAGTNCGSVR
jgi:nucleoside-diphosphate-sugar epimerase